MTRLIIDSDKLRIRICGGMHCAGNGGGRPLEAAFERALEEAGAADKVDIYRAHCLGECANGPCVRIGQDRFYHVRQEDVPSLVQNEVLPRI